MYERIQDFPCVLAGVAPGPLFFYGVRMTLCRMIAPQWLLDENKHVKKTQEKQFTDDEIKKFNRIGYNIYFWPNHPSTYDPNHTVDGSQIDVFNFIFVDFDLKLGTYPSKDAFFEALGEFPLQPTSVVDSGNGIHVYWKVSDLDANSYLRLQRRIVRRLNTDPATCMICQLMRLPGTMNTKQRDNLLLCESIFEADNTYTCEELDKVLPAIEAKDEEFCQQHFAKTYHPDRMTIEVDDKLPVKFGALLNTNSEVKELWSTPSSDRSKTDYRLGHLMFASGFTKEEARSVLVNSAKALQRMPIHRLSYAENIISKIWTFEEAPAKAKIALSQSVADILKRSSDEDLKGTRFPCQPYFDGTDYGFRLGQVLGLAAGVGVGKTAIALNIFKGFVERNPDYVHMFVSLEMTQESIALRWKKVCGTNLKLHEKVHVLANYETDGTYRHLSLTDIQEYILSFEKEFNVKVGCVCIDHIGVLKQQDKSGEYQGLRDICSQLKSFAIATKTMFIIQSQTNRDKAGIGDLELHKDAGYGTQSYEAFLDFLMVCWQPLKRCYNDPTCPKVTAYKFAKIREKSNEDKIIEDQCYRLSFDPETQTLSPMTQDQEISFDYFAKQALNKRKLDRKTDLVAYTSIRWGSDEKNSGGSEIRPFNSYAENTSNSKQKH